MYDPGPSFFVGFDGVTPEMQQAFYLLRLMSEGERAFLFKRFCRSCHRILASGEACNCQRDE